jgi:transcriptional regulator with XRE-family HTH domain
MKGEGNPADLRLLLILLRGVKGWNQADLAKAARVDRASISDYERGIRAPSRKTLERILEAGGVPYSKLDQILPLLRALRVVAEASPMAPPGKPHPGPLSRAAAELALAELTAVSLEIEALAQAAREKTPSPLAAVQERLREESAKATDGGGPELAELASRVADLSRDLA